MQIVCPALVFCSALEYTLFMALRHSGDYKGTQNTDSHQTHLLLAIQDIQLFLTACGAHH